MKKSRFTDSQIVEALKRVEAGLPVTELCREFGFSTATFCKWRAKFGGMDTSMMVRMKELEDENLRLKKMYMDEKLKSEILSEAHSQKSGEAVSQARDGHASCSAARRADQAGLRGLCDQRVLLPLRVQTKCRERRDRRLVDSPD